MYFYYVYVFIYTKLKGNVPAVTPCGREGCLGEGVVVSVQRNPISFDFTKFYFFLSIKACKHPILLYTGVRN